VTIVALSSAAWDATIQDVPIQSRLVRRDHSGGPRRCQASSRADPEQLATQLVVGQLGDEKHVLAHDASERSVRPQGEALDVADVPIGLVADILSFPAIEHSQHGLTGTA
jgi:hypothetical protein